VSKSAARARLAEIIRKRSFGRGEITLASGRKSNFYFNLKPTMLDPEGAALLAELTYEALKDDQLDFVGGLEMGAVPLAGAIAQLSWIKGHPIAAFFVRKKPKEHGAKLAVEGLAKGETLQGKRIVIVEDVTTTGGSAMKAVEAVREAGGIVALVFTMVDREEGATEAFAEAGLPFRSLYKAGEFLKGCAFFSPRPRSIHRHARACPGHDELKARLVAILFAIALPLISHLPSPVMVNPGRGACLPRPVVLRRVE
jgi:orotate phosphoribosyltransferase